MAYLIYFSQKAKLLYFPKRRDCLPGCTIQKNNFTFRQDLFFLMYLLLQKPDLSSLAYTNPKVGYDCNLYDKRTINAKFRESDFL